MTESGARGRLRAARRGMRRGVVAVRSLLRHPGVRAVGVAVVIGIVLAIISGPEGRSDEPAYSVSQSLHPHHLFLWIGIALGVELLVFGIGRGRRTIGPTVAAGRARVADTFSDRRSRYVAYAVLLVLVVFLPRTFLGLYWSNVLVEQIGIYALLAIGLNVVVGFAGLLDLGYIAFYAIGAYVTAYFTNTLPVHPPFTINPFLVLPIAVLAAMTAGLILGAPTLRLRGDYLAIVTLGFGEIITILAINLDSVTNSSRGAFGIPQFSINVAGIHYKWPFQGLPGWPYYYLLLAFIVTILWAFHLLEDSRVGRAWTAIREDEVAAQACGIPPVKYKLMAFAIGASTSGFAGVLYASKIGFINPSNFTVSNSILVLVLVIFGGMGSLIGSVVGAAILQTAFAYVRKNNTVNVEDIYIYVGLLLIVMMIYRPQGIVPSRRRAREIGLAEHGIGTADALAAPAGGSTP